MNPARWKQIDELFDAVLELPETERESFLSSKCAGDDELKQKVLTLLAAQDQTVNFMEISAMKLMGKAIADYKENSADNSLHNKTIGTYKIEKLLGAGGMGEVYLARDTKLNRKVALKILPAEFIADDERVRRFQLEARTISALNHPNIVTIYDVGSFDGINYIATEYVEGETLREFGGGGKRRLKEILQIVTQCCDALATAHAAGIIHRDIKPENIMIRPDGYVKILDFGLAKLSDTSFLTFKNLSKTAKGIIIGTPAYMSPEQVSDDRIDHRTDLWSVGVVLFEMLTGVNPFKGDSRQATFQKILSGEPPLVSQLNPKLPRELDAILSKALEKDADVSYQSASDLRADLRRVRREIDSSTSLRSGSLSQKSEVATHSREKFLLFTFIFLLLPLSAAIWYFGFHRNQINAVDWSKATNIQLTEQTGTEYYPSLAPDGKSFVYASDASGNYDLYVQRVGGKTATNLTADSAATDTEPAFSPDGRQIAFRSEREPKGIYVIGESGENPRRVADFGFQPSWSPDGKEIVVGTFGPSAPSVHQGADNGLWIVNVETGAKREVLHEDATFPAWSPSGKRIAYWFYPESFGRRDIATIPAGGGEPIVITKDFARSNWNPVWSPDGKFLYFVSDKSGNINFWRVAIDETTGEALSEPEPVNAHSKYTRHLNFSRDGKRMIYAQTENEANIQGIEFDSQNEKTVGEWFWITRGDREVIRAELSPDGKQFVMRQTRRTQDDIVVFNRDSGNWRDITSDEPFDRYPRWSPDGKQIALASDRNNGYEIWICNADGSNLRQVSFHYLHQYGSSFPTWSPDGKSLIYTNNSKPYLLDLTKNWQQQQAPLKALTDAPDQNFVVWDWSPDGKKLLGTVPLGERAIAAYNIETKTFERIIEDIDTGSVIPSWLADSRRFVYIKDNKVFLTDSETKKSKEIHSRQPVQIRSPFISRDGKLLYYTMVFNESDIWLLDLPPDS